MLAFRRFLAPCYTIPLRSTQTSAAALRSRTSSMSDRVKIWSTIVSPPNRLCRLSNCNHNPFDTPLLTSSLTVTVTGSIRVRYSFQLYQHPGTWQGPSHPSPLPWSPTRVCKWRRITHFCSPHNAATTVELHSFLEIRAVVHYSVRTVSFSLLCCTMPLHPRWRD